MSKTPIVIVVLSFAFSACGGDDEPPRREARPDSGIPDAAVPRGCAFDEPSCTGETLCINNNCEAAFGRIYQITVLNGEVPTTNQGQPWDVGGGAPDLYVSIAVNGTPIATTTPAQDQFMATWNEFTTANIVAGTKLEFTVIDQDVSDSDVAFSCTWDPLAVSDIRGVNLECAGAPGSLSAIIAPN